jgi:hypothetical protein
MTLTSAIEPHLERVLRRLRSPLRSIVRSPAAYVDAVAWHARLGAFRFQNSR